MNAKAAAKVLDELLEMMVANVDFSKKQEAKFRTQLERVDLGPASRRHFAGKVRHYKAMAAKYQHKADALSLALAELAS